MKGQRKIGDEYDMSFGKMVKKRMFNTFAVVLTSRGAFFETYTGFHIWTTPFAMSPKGAVEKNLYQWLKNLVEVAEEAEAEPDKKVGDTEMTTKEMADHMALLTECCLTHPMVAFTDMEKATEFALKHIEWLNEMTKKLAEAMDAGPWDTDMESERILTEDAARMEVAEMLDKTIDGSGE